MSQPVAAPHPACQDLAAKPTAKLVPVQKTAGEWYEEELAKNGPFIKPPDDADDETRRRYREADFRRWMSLRMALASGHDKKYISRLRAADTIEKLNAARSRDQAVMSINDLVKREGVDGFIAKLEQAQGAAAEAAAERLKLAATTKALATAEQNDAIPRRPMTAEEVAALGKSFNVYVREDNMAADETDEVYQDLRAKAEQARAFIQLGMPRVEYADGVDAETDVAVREKFETDALVAASTLLRFEKWQDKRTRNDSVWSRQVSVDLGEFSDRMQRESHGTKDRLDDLSLLDGIVIQSKIEESKEKVFATLVFLEVFEVPVYTSRLLNIILQRPLPRTMPFTEAYAVYTAAFGVLMSSDVVDSHNKVTKNRKAKNAELRAAGFKKLTPAVKDNRDDYSRVECHRAVLEFRQHARACFAVRVQNLLRWYVELDKAHEDDVYWRESDEPRPEVDTGAATRWEIVFYQNLYFAVQDHCVDILNALEGGILLLLHKFILKKERQYLSTQPAVPPVNIMHADMPDKLIQMSAALSEKRRQFATKKRKKSSRMRLPEIPQSGLGAKVDPLQSWAPTFGEMRDFLEFFAEVAGADQKAMRDDLRKFEAQLRQKDREQQAEAKKRRLKGAADSETGVVVGPAREEE